MIKKQLLGLIGYPLSHSFSKKYFTEKFKKEGVNDFQYELFPLEKIDLLTDLLEKHPNIKGLNVTIPYKELVLPFLKELSPAAEQIGAVNTINIKNGELYGFNTDVYGFEKSLAPLLKSNHQKALILGTGGAAKAVQYVLEKLNIDFKYVSRTPQSNQLTYSNIDKNTLTEYHLIINTTPLGMSPKIDSCPAIAYEHLTDQHLLYDLVYNPPETLFLKKGKDQGATIKNGLEMLVLQAEKSWEIYGI